MLNDKELFGLTTLIFGYSPLLLIGCLMINCTRHLPTTLPGGLVIHSLDEKGSFDSINTIFLVVLNATGYNLGQILPYISDDT